MRRSMLTAGLAAGLLASGLLPALAPVAAGGPAPLAERVGGIVLFGDSDSDDGNAYRLTHGHFPVSPPYADGRFSNGPVWIERVRDRLGIPAERYTNLAVGGAFTGRGNIASAVAPGTPVESALAETGMLDQLDQWLGAGHRPRPDDLIVLWGGDNDYGLAWQPDASAVTEAAGHIAIMVRQLASLGARQFLVATLNEDLFAPIDRENDADATIFVNPRNHNDRLLAQMAELGPSLGVEIVIFDTRPVFRALATDPGAWGFTEAETPCYGGDFITPGPVCEAPEQAVFWDDQHWTAAVHARFADQALAALGTVPIGVDADSR